MEATDTHSQDASRSESKASSTKSLIRILEERDKRVGALLAELREELSRSCSTCDQWAVHECGKWNETPPDEVIVNGCDDWEMKVPF